MPLCRSTALTTARFNSAAGLIMAALLTPIVTSGCRLTLLYIAIKCKCL